MCLHLMQIHNCLTLKMGVGGERKSAYEQHKAGVHLNLQTSLITCISQESIVAQN